MEKGLERTPREWFPLVIFAIGYQTWPRKEPLRERNTVVQQVQVQQGRQDNGRVGICHRQRADGTWEEWETETQEGNGHATGADREIIGRTQSTVRSQRVSIVEGEAILRRNAQEKTDKGCWRITE